MHDFSNAPDPEFPEEYKWRGQEGLGVFCMRFPLPAKQNGIKWVMECPKCGKTERGYFSHFSPSGRKFSCLHFSDKCPLYRQS